MNTETQRPNLKPAELARRWGTTTGSLANMRSAGKGPDYLKIGSRVMYPMAAIEAYEAACTVRTVA
jgi:hypothetical protein